MFKVLLIFISSLMYGDKLFDHQLLKQSYTFPLDVTREIRSCHSHVKIFSWEINNHLIIINFSLETSVNSVQFWLLRIIPSMWYDFCHFYTDEIRCYTKSNQFCIELIRKSCLRLLEIIVNWFWVNINENISFKSLP